MKKLAAIATLAMMTAGAFAQGTITWGNTGATAIQFAGGPNDGLDVHPGGAYVVGLYIGDAGTTAFDALTLVTTRNFATQATSATHGFAGVFPNQTYATTLATGTSVAYAVAAWSGGFASYAAAMADPTGQAYAGKSGIGGGVLGGGPTPAFAASLNAAGIGPGAVGMGAVAPFTISQVPEPATASLLGLGLASLLIFRRRK